MAGHAERAPDLSQVGVVTLAICEDFDIGIEERVMDRVREALSMGPERLVIDLSSCPFIDVVGAGALVEAHRAARRAGSELVLRGASRRVLQVLDLCGLAGVFRTERGSGA